MIDGGLSRVGGRVSRARTSGRRHTDSLIDRGLGTSVDRRLAILRVGRGLILRGVGRALAVGLPRTRRHAARTIARCAIDRVFRANVVEGSREWSLPLNGSSNELFASKVVLMHHGSAASHRDIWLLIELGLSILSQDVSINH